MTPSTPATHTPDIQAGRLPAEEYAKRFADATPRFTHSQALLEAAHQVCPYSNATRGNIEVSISLA